MTGDLRVLEFTMTRLAIGLPGKAELPEEPQERPRSTANVRTAPGIAVRRP